MMNDRAFVIAPMAQRALANVAVIGGVNELSWGAIPLLASPQGGEGCVIKKFRVATEADAAGVVFRPPLRFGLIGKPPRPRYQRKLRDVFFDRSATPPCGDARRGIALDANFFTASMKV
jgi:hypothetical protein